MTKLTQHQQDLLKRAADREDGAIDAADDERITAASLIKRGLMISLPTDGGASRLIITGAGRVALGETAAASSARGVSEQPPFPKSKRARRQSAPEGKTASSEDTKPPKGKLGKLIELLRRPEGATIEAMMAATGWQAHSVRGAMSGALKKKQGLAIASDKSDAGRVYRIVDEAAA
jgi:hypothetical protein